MKWSTKPGEEVDHRRPDRLLNTRENLRICTHQQNTWNTPRVNTTSGLRGVYWSGEGSSFSASIKTNLKKLNLGSYTDPFDAAMAYNTKAQELYGEFAILNDPDATDIYEDLRKRAREATAATPLSKRNKTGLRGVYQQQPDRWGSDITISGQHIHLCTCGTKEEAAYIFEQASIQVQGDKAKLIILSGPSVSWPSQTVDAA